MGTDCMPDPASDSHIHRGDRRTTGSLIHRLHFCRAWSTRGGRGGRLHEAGDWHKVRDLS